MFVVLNHFTQQCYISIIFLLLQDFQLWCDLREFELRMRCRYLTHRGDQEHWIRYAQERGIHLPSHLCQDPDSELDM